MEVIATIFILIAIALVIGLAASLFALMAIDQDRYNLYGDVYVKGWEQYGFITIGNCRHKKTHFTPCGSCGFWHPYKYIRHLFLKRQFSNEWNTDRLQRIKDHADERTRVQSS